MEGVNPCTLETFTEKKLIFFIAFERETLDLVGVLLEREMGGGVWNRNAWVLESVFGQEIPGLGEGSVLKDKSLTLGLSFGIETSDFGGFVCLLLVLDEQPVLGRESRFEEFRLEDKSQSCFIVFNFVNFRHHNLRSIH